jgi:hypothetical protein
MQRREVGPMTTRLDLECDPGGTAAFSTLFQQGVRIEARLGRSIREVLCRSLGVSDDYLDNRLNTIFLDGKPVDDADTALISEGSVLALSASMPGLVGAVMRKGGYYASMRSTITYSAGDSRVTPKKGFFTLKLYNMTMPELAPRFLASGVWVEAGFLDEFFKTKSKRFFEGCVTVRADGKEMPAHELPDLKWREMPGFVMLRVTHAADRGGSR